MEESARVHLDRLKKGLREIPSVSGAESLVRHHLQAPLLTGTRHDSRDEVAALRGTAVETVEARGADDKCARRVGERRVLAGELRERVDATGRRRGILRIGRAGLTVEDVVGAEVHELGVSASAALRETLH